MGRCIKICALLIGLLTLTAMSDCRGALDSGQNGSTTNGGAGSNGSGGGRY